MNCKKIKNLISQYIDNEISIKNKLIVEEHIGICENCKGFYEENLKLLGVLEKTEKVSSFLNEKYIIKKALSQNVHKKVFVNLWKYAYLFALIIGFVFGISYYSFNYMNSVNFQKENLIISIGFKSFNDIADNSIEKIVFSYNQEG